MRSQDHNPLETSSRVASLCIIFPILLFLPFYKLCVKKESLIVGLKGEEENEALRVHACKYHLPSFGPCHQREFAWKWSAKFVRRVGQRRASNPYQFATWKLTWKLSDQSVVSKEPKLVRRIPSNQSDERGKIPIFINAAAVSKEMIPRKGFPIHHLSLLVSHQTDWGRSNFREGRRSRHGLVSGSSERLRVIFPNSFGFL